LIGADQSLRFVQSSPSDARRRLATENAEALTGRRLDQGRDLGVGVALSIAAQDLAAAIVPVGIVFHRCLLRLLAWSLRWHGRHSQITNSGRE
jgi:hypothetical protein